MKKWIAILGAGGQAREVEWLIRKSTDYRFIGYIVGDLTKKGEHDCSDRVLGDESWLESNHVDCLTIGIGTPSVRLEIANRLETRFPKINWPALVHPTASLDDSSCTLGPGVLVCAGVVSTVNIDFGAFSLINFGVTIGHEARIGRGCVINPGANISGGVVLGDGVLVGTGAQVLQYVKVGAGAKIGAGAVVLRDVEAGTTVVGVPAKEVKKPSQ